MLTSEGVVWFLEGFADEDTVAGLSFNDQCEWFSMLDANLDELDVSWKIGFLSPCVFCESHPVCSTCAITF